MMWTPTRLTFPSGSGAHRAEVSAQHWSSPASPASPAGAGNLGRSGAKPCVVMAHGLAGTVDSGLVGYADAFAALGLEVLAFDFRGFGASAGAPRQTVSVSRQQEDYRAALQAAAALPGVDPQRMVLWGVSLSGGHVFEVAADRDDVAAVIALTPLVDGYAAGRHALTQHSPGSLVKATVNGARSRLGARLGAAPRKIPVVAPPGQPGALTLPGAMEDYLAIAGPTWRNEIDAAIALELGSFRPIKAAGRLKAPLLVQIADFDRSAPPQSAAKAAFAGRGEVRHYPCDHFDVWPGKAWFDASVAHQVAFLRRHLALAG